MSDKFKFIYGPVPSWRLRSSLGVDPLSGREKICTFDCTYCQLGKTEKFSEERKIYVPTDKILKEIGALPSAEIDYITFSGMGEPTLAKNLGQMVKGIRKIRKEKIALLSNSSLLGREEVREDLASLDFVMLKLDACSGKSFARINRPLKGITFDRVLRNIKDFRAGYRGRLALQIMFMKENKDEVKELAYLAREIGPEEIQINTPLRPSPVEPLSKKEIAVIKESFQELTGNKIEVVSAYEGKPGKVSPFNRGETLRRRGKKENGRVQFKKEQS